MIEWLTFDHLAAYRRKRDPLWYWLGDERALGCESERWLSESEPKRMVAWHVYRTLIATTGLRILDIGGGYSSLSFLLSARHHYRVVDLEPPPDGVEAHVGDWTQVSPEGWDLVVSVDLFPNVDQRLAAFLERFREVPMRLALTVYDDKTYRARRPEGEWLTVRAWDWDQTRRVLCRAGFEVQRDDAWGDDLFGNGRQVCILAS